MSQPSYKKELGFAAGMLALSLALLLQSFSYRADSSQFPRFLMVLQVLFSAALLAKGLLARPWRLAGAAAVPATNWRRLAAEIEKPLAVFVATSAYLLCIQYLGYYASTALFLTGSMFYFGERRLLVTLGVTGLFVLSIYALFVMFIGVRLPEGLLR